MTIDKIAFREFLESYLKHGKSGFDDYTYDFDAYLADAEMYMLQGNISYELPGGDTKTGLPECFDFDVFVPERKRKDALAKNVNVLAALNLCDSMFR